MILYNQELQGVGGINVRTEIYSLFQSKNIATNDDTQYVSA
jgi:hypothetical protein